MYAIKAWNDIFENNRSRQFDEPKYVNWPVRRDSEGFASLMRDVKGMAAFGLFGALVQWLGRQPANARRAGVLADDKGEMTPERFAVRMGARAVDVRAAWDRLVSVGWIVKVTSLSQDCHHDDIQVTVDRHPFDTEPTPTCAGEERRGEEHHQEQQAAKSAACHAGAAAADAGLRQWAAERARRPEWLPQGKGWIRAGVWLKTAQDCPTVTREQFDDIIREAKASRTTLANPAGFVLAKLREIGGVA